MSEIRKGDTVIAVDMSSEWTVTDHDHTTVTGRDGRGRERTFRKDDLECVDPDDGLWQEMLG